MGNVIKSITGSARIQAILVAWFMPLLLPSFVFVVFVLPKVEQTPVVESVRDAADVLDINGTLMVLILTFVVAVFGFLNRRFLYRILEGLEWPRWLQDWRVEHAHRLHYDVLVQERSAALANEGVQATETALGRANLSAEARVRLEATRAQYEADRAKALGRRHAAIADRKARAVHGWRRRLPRRSRPLFTPAGSSTKRYDWRFPYPEERSKVMPTIIGNALKRVETYGHTRFGLDSQILWYEMYSTCPDSVRAAYDDAEMQADTYVCSIFGAYALAASALWSSVSVWDWGSDMVGLLVVAVGSLVTASLLKRGLVRAIDDWGDVVRSIVNISLPSLRKVYMLPEPSSTQDLKEMHAVLAGLSYFPEHPYYLDALLRYQETKRANDKAARGVAGPDSPSGPGEPGQPGEPSSGT